MTWTPAAGTPALGVEDVGRDGRDRVIRAVRHAILRAWERCGSIVGDLHFSARWEPAAPRTIEAIRRMLPIESKLIHCRWTGESTWIPFGDFRPGLDYENHTSHPAPGPAGDLPGRHQRVRDLLPVRRLHDGVEGRPAGGQPVRHRRRRRGLGRPAARDGPALPVGGRPGDLDPRGRVSSDVVDARPTRSSLMPVGEHHRCRGGITPRDRPGHPRRDGRHGDRVADRPTSRSTAGGSWPSSPTCRVPRRAPTR